MSARRSPSTALLQFTPLGVPILVLCAMSIFSLWATFDVRFSLPKVLGLLGGAMLFYVGASWLRTPDLTSKALVLYIALGTGIAFVSLFSTNWLSKNPWLSGLTATLPRWTMRWPGAELGFSPNEVGGVLLWFVPLQWALLVDMVGHRPSSRLATGLLLPCAGLCALTLLLTQSRGAWLGLAVGALCMLAVKKWRLRAIAAAASVLVLVFLGLGGGSWLQTVLRRGLAPEALGASNWEFRVRVWRAALLGIRDFPLTGMGMGTFRRLARVLYPIPITPLTYDIAHAHNGWLQAALDLGLPGALAYTAVWIAGGSMALQAARIAPARLAAAALGLFGSVVSSAVFHLTDAVALGSKGGMAWWLMLALIAALWHSARPAVVGGSPDGRRQPRT